jgi:hypothetical protein
VVIGATPPVTDDAQVMHVGGGVVVGATLQIGDGVVMAKMSIPTKMSLSLTVTLCTLPTHPFNKADGDNTRASLPS